MNYWEVLSIEPTSDRKAVKRAYAKKLKATHPEDEPEAFQELQEAYQRALSDIRHQTEVDGSELPKVQSQSNDKLQEGVISDHIASNSEHGDISRTLMSESDFLNVFKSTLKSNTDDAWKAFFDSPEVADFEYRNDMLIRLFSVLLEHQDENRKLEIPKAHCSTLCQNFQWQQHQMELCKIFGHHDVDRVLTQLKLRIQKGAAKFVPQTVEQEEEVRDVSVDSKAFTYLSTIILLFVLVIVYVMNS
ncbi:J domain-containing protein [Pleionea sp. CnH1-48]|uniref:J domain-containing protein n=1 Tax=Pleionea sp. CnH1-48 TaxID=2954494 RepID=UPI0020978C63|nr:J domain-containing protein [Pleionea sp. CnH1-48]MCO7223027.1 J domain-containing protein [Pleionea sp. CnH1-48]